MENKKFTHITGVGLPSPGNPEMSERETLTPWCRVRTSRLKV